jgi:hypothetical protein
MVLGLAINIISEGYSLLGFIFVLFGNIRTFRMNLSPLILGWNSKPRKKPTGAGGKLSFDPEIYEIYSSETSVSLRSTRRVRTSDPA